MTGDPQIYNCYWIPPTNPAYIPTPIYYPVCQNNYSEVQLMTMVIQNMQKQLDEMQKQLKEMKDKLDVKV